MCIGVVYIAFWKYLARRGIVPVPQKWASFTPWMKRNWASLFAIVGECGRMWCRAHFKFQGNYRTTCPMTPMTFSQNLGWFRIHDYSLIPHLHWFLRRWRPRRPSKGTSARDGTFLRRINTHLVQKEKRITNTLEHKCPKNMFKI